MSVKKTYELKHERHIPMVCVLSLLLTLITGCSSIDDDLSDCGNDYQLNYELQLVTNISTELQTELTTQTEVTIANALRTHLSGIFTDFAHDIDLSFYETEGDSLRLQHDEHIMNANQASYTLYLPMRQYMHLAVANVVNNPLVSLEKDEVCHTSQLYQKGQTLASSTGIDTISSHTTGLFTARQPMEVVEGIDQKFNVRLYMANCAAALVLDPRGKNMDGMRVFSTGFATAFQVADSIFSYPKQSPIVRTQTITSEESNLTAFCSVTFPSREHAAHGNTRTIIETTDAFVAEADEETLWEFRTYVPCADGTITETRLGIKEPLRGGQLKIIKCWLDEKGVVKTDDQEVAASVKLNWKEGSEFTPHL
ncbi:MAG: hypothetical protein IJ693_03840 [Bacteroidaceae bacterium]|nr:hypothetical protein [Bacteroidaceae bacterium]